MTSSNPSCSIVSLEDMDNDDLFSGIEGVLNREPAPETSGPIVIDDAPSTSGDTTMAVVVPTGRPRWGETYIPLGGSFMDDNDERTGLPRSQVFGSDGKRIQDESLGKPTSWMRIVGIRRGIRLSKLPYDQASYREVNRRLGDSIAWSRVNNILEGRGWGSVTGATVTIYRIMREGHPQYGQFWAIVSSEGSQTCLARMDMVFPPRAASERDMVDENGERKSGEHFVTRVSGVRDDEAGGGVITPGAPRDPKYLASRSARPSKRGTPRHKESRQPGRDPSTEGLKPRALGAGLAGQATAIITSHPPALTPSAMMPPPGTIAMMPANNISWVPASQNFQPAIQPDTERNYIVTTPERCSSSASLAGKLKKRRRK